MTTYIQKMMDTLLFSLFVWALILKDTENNSYHVLIRFSFHKTFIDHEICLQLFQLLDKIKTICKALV